MLALKEYPDFSHSSLLDVLLSIQAEIILSQHFYFKNDAKALETLKKQQRIMDKNDDSIELADEISLSIESVKAGRACYGEHSLTICVLGDSLEDLNEKIHLVESKLNQKSELITAREYDGVELAYWGQLPGNHNYRMRNSLINSLNMAGFANLHNYPKGQREGNHWGEALAVLETSSHTPYYFNFHVNQVGNSLFLGPMGKGKTLLLSAFLTLSTKYGGWRYIFDKDEGMEIIVRALGGSYHIIEPGKPSGMAPFQLEDTPENRAFNILLLKRILSTDSGLTTQDKRTIGLVVKGAYELDKHLRTFKNIAPFFGISRPGNLRERFDLWHSDGQNAWIFDNETDSFDISNKISGQGIGNLLKPEYEELSTPVLMYIFHRLGQKLDSSPTAVFIPEGWKALSDTYFQEQIKDWSKTPRKNNLALIVDTQNPAELAASEAGRSMVKEAVTQVLFANEKAEWKDYQQFNLNPREFEIIKEVLPTMENEHFFLLKQGGVSVIARLNLQGLEEDIPVLSGNKASVMLLSAIRKKVGDDKSAWLPHFYKLSKQLKTEFNNDFIKFEPVFNQYWEYNQ